MTLLDRYIMRVILGATAMVMAVLLALYTLFTFIEQQSDIGVGHYGALSALWFALLTLPQHAWEMLPIGALLGALLGLGTLARGSELTVMRASGVSVARLAAAALVAGVVLMGIEVALGEFLAPPLQQTARQQKAFAKYSNVSFGGGGAWVRDGNLILNVERQSGRRQFGGMLIFQLSPQHQLQSIGHAARATAGPNRRWLLSGYAESRFEGNRVLARKDGARVLASNVTAGFLGLAMTEPGRMRASELWGVIRYYRANRLDARPYVFAFWSRIARVVAIAFAVLLALPFVLGSLRASGTGTRMLVGLLIGLAYFFLQRLIESGTVVFHLDPLLLAWLPTALLAAVTLGLLARAR